MQHSSMSNRILAPIFVAASKPPKEEVLRNGQEDDVLDVAFAVAMQKALVDDGEPISDDRPLKATFLSDDDTESIILEDSRVLSARPAWRGTAVDAKDDDATCVGEHAQFFASSKRVAQHSLPPRVGAMVLFSFLQRRDDVVCTHRMLCIEDKATCDLWRSYAVMWCQAPSPELRAHVDRIKGRFNKS
jgi:hypothetical protein